MSIRAKIIAIILTSLLFVGTVFLVYAVSANIQTQQLSMDKVRNRLLYESEQVNKTIACLEQNALDLATAGRSYYTDDTGDTEMLVGNQLVVDNFRAIPQAVGGGIWYEPFTCYTDKELVCFYACRNEKGEVSAQAGFNTPEYNYPHQIWYTEIKAEVKKQHDDAVKAGKKMVFSVVWSEVYHEKIGSKACMATVGAGIYDKGDFVGMATVDWQIQDVFTQLRQIPHTAHGFVMLIDPQYDCVLMDTRQDAPDEEDQSEHQFKRMSSIPWIASLNKLTKDSVTRSDFTYYGYKMLSFGRQLDNGMLLLFQVPESELNDALDAHNVNATVLCILLLLGTLAFAMFFLTTNINRPLSRLMSELEQLGNGNLDVTLDVQRNDEIGVLGKTFNRMTVDLKQHIAQKKQEDAAKQRINNELEIATSIQLSALPCHFPPFPDRKDFDLYATMEPAKAVGGDFYDFFLVDDDHLVLVIADVSGKGIPAAMFMMKAKTLIKTIASAKLEPAEILTHANDQLSENNETGMFVTLFLGIVELSTGRFTFSDAGHLPPLWKKRGASSYEWIDMEAASTFVLGAIEGLEYTQAEITLNPGEELFFYTDGVTEATSVDKQLFGAERLIQSMDTLADDALPLPQKLAGLRSEIRQFCQGAEQSDDITMLIFSYRAGC